MEGDDEREVIRSGAPQGIDTNGAATKFEGVGKVGKLQKVR